jgi:hypothetical protein
MTMRGYADADADLDPRTGKPKSIDPDWEDRSERIDLLEELGKFGFDIPAIENVPTDALRHILDVLEREEEDDLEEYDENDVLERSQGAGGRGRGAFTRAVPAVVRELAEIAQRVSRDQKRKAVDTFCEQQIRRYRLLPDEVPAVRARLLRTDSRAIIRRCSETGRAQTELDAQMQEIARRPSLVDGRRIKEPGELPGFLIERELPRAERFFEDHRQAFTRFGFTKAQFVRTYLQAPARDRRELVESVR